ncbi:helix-turn-helix domain-containing protein [Clostridium botulinum]|nr:helix-turn-helix domain-containing protein [Clostridium botulinum]MCS4526141.1 helix-turn-helix domain-containing protein [Clostridium botulinum]
MGSCRVTVTKILNSFQEKGMISLGYKKIKIIDEKGLKKNTTTILYKLICKKFKIFDKTLP